MDSREDSAPVHCVCNTIQLSENVIFVFPRFARQCRRTSYLRWPSKASFDCLLIGNISTKNIRIHSSVSKSQQAKGGTFFKTRCSEHGHQSLQGYIGGHQKSIVSRKPMKSRTSTQYNIVNTHKLLISLTQPTFLPLTFRSLLETFILLLMKVSDRDRNVKGKNVGCVKQISNLCNNLPTEECFIVNTRKMG